MDLRQYPRFAVRYPVAYSGSNVAGVGTILDLSAAGCRVRTYATIPTRMNLELRVYALGPDFPMKVERAAVRWSTGGEFGLEFVRTRPEELKRLQLFVSTLDLAGGA